MTHYSRHCLHLGCGEPLGHALVKLTTIKNTNKTKKRKKHQQARRTEKHKA